LRSFSFTALILILIVCAAAPAGARQYSNRIIAVINGEAITMFELNQRMRPFLNQIEGKDLNEAEQEAVRGLQKQVLDQMIDDILLEQEIEKIDIEVNESEIENRIRTMRQKLDAQGQTLDDFLRLEGYDMEELKSRIRDEILKHKLVGFWVRRKVVVTQEEIENYYEENKADYQQERRVAVRLIVPAESQPADQLRRRIVQGELSFDEAADIYSQGPGVGDGGYIGFLNWKDLAPEWKDALSGLEAGDVSRPFVTQGREALLQVVEIESGEAPPLEEVREEIKDEIFEKKYSEQLDEYIGGLREKAVIDIKI
jgi:peptidyl-prolyl cis-trans isomerase SurA